MGAGFESLLNVYELVRKSDVCFTFVSCTNVKHVVFTGGLIEFNITDNINLISHGLIQCISIK